MKILLTIATTVFALLALSASGIADAPQTVAADGHDRHPESSSPNDWTNLRHALRMIDQGRHTFRDDTFGDEVFWGDTLRLHRAIAGRENGGFGRGLSPVRALKLGLKVDSQRLPDAVKVALRKGEVDLEDPKTTVQLLRLNAVVGMRGFFDESSRQLTSVGITCALCHSTVDDSFAPGIGNRLDGWAAGDLDIGAIIALAPNLQPLVDLLSFAVPGIDEDTVKSVLKSWGPGKFDAGLLMDGKAFQPDGEPAATLIPAAFGLAGVNLHTWTGWGSVTHWNAFVANLEMQGQGTFVDPRLNDPSQFPIAAAAGFADVRHDPDLVTPRLAALQFYQLSLRAPKPPRHTYDAQAAVRGEDLFNGKANCASCHVPPIFTEPGWNLHTAAEIGIDEFQAGRSPENAYRTAPLKGLWTRGDRGYYHDGRFPRIMDVIKHYNEHFMLGLSYKERLDLEQYLRSL